MVVRDLNVQGVSSRPSEADSPLVVDSNAVLPLPVPPQPFQAVPWGYPEVVHSLSRVHQQEFSVRPALHIWWQQPRALPPEHLLGFAVREAANHPAYNNAYRYYRNALLRGTQPNTYQAPGCQ